ncbi:hypothetical protein D3C71_1516050 [compost metagenome]
MRRIAARLRALQGGEQCIGTALQCAADGGREVDLVQLTRADSLLDGCHGRLKVGAAEAVCPRDLRSVCRGVACNLVQPRLGRVVHRKPRQRTIGRMRLQGGIERGCRLVAHMAHTPVAALGSRMHSVEHTAHVGQGVCRQHLPRGSKAVPKPRSVRVQWLGEVDARNMSQNRR